MALRILLIHPAESDVLQANLPREIEAVRGANPPISLLQVAAAAREWAGADVRVVDAHAQGFSPARVAEMAAALRPDWVGLGAVSFTMRAVMAQVAALKRAVPRVPVWLGGLQPFLYPEETAALPGVDGLVLGEGEHPLAALCRCAGDWAALRQVPGLRFCHNGETIDTGVAPPIASLDELPQPAYDLLEPRFYSSVLTDRRPVAIAVTSRGCPYRCSFCSRSVTGKRFRSHGPDYVLQTFALLKRLGFAAVLVYDEVFTIDKPRVRAICDGLRTRGLALPWMARATVPSVDEALLRDMAAAGCEWITFGIEAGAERVLKRLNKALDLAQAREVFAAARRVGLKTLAYFMVGNPEESATEVAESERFLLTLDPDMAHVAVYTVYPATDLYQEGMERGYFPDVWRDFARDPSQPFEAPLWPGPLSKDQRFAAVRRLYRRFYLRPRRIWREIRNLTSWAAFRRRVRYALTLLSPAR